MIESTFQGPGIHQLCPGDAMAKAAALSAAKDLGDAKEVEELLQAGL